MLSSRKLRLSASFPLLRLSILITSESLIYQALRAGIALTLWKEMFFLEALELAARSHVNPSKSCIILQRTFPNANIL
jgi:hypothetical protein